MSLSCPLPNRNRLVGSGVAAPVVAMKTGCWDGLVNTNGPTSVCMVLPMTWESELPERVVRAEAQKVAAPSITRSDFEVTA